MVMSDVLVKIAALAVSVGVLGSLFRQEHSGIAQGLTLAAGALVLYLALRAAAPVVALLQRLLQMLSQGQAMVQIALQVTAVAIVGELAAQVCVDTGQAGMAQYVRLGCRILALVITSPVFLEVLTWADALG